MRDTVRSELWLADRLARQAKTLPAANELWQMYQEQGSVHRVGKLLGTTGDTIHRRLVKAGYKLRGSNWSEEELLILRKWYETHSSSASFSLTELAATLNRPRANVSRKARSIGLSNKNRPKPEFRERMAQQMAEYIQKNGHPRGALGLKFTPEALAKISKASRRTWDARTQEERDAHTNKSVDARIARGTLIQPRPQASWKAGWREIGETRKYYRSRWEANYARYLEWLKAKGQIVNWEHEPKTFWFDKIKRGCRTYLPDFLVVENDGRESYHEVKGWMDARSITKIKRMRIYHPNVTLVVIAAKQYRALQKQVKGMVPEWESGR